MEIEPTAAAAGADRLNLSHCAVRTMAPDIFQTSIFQSAATRCLKFAWLTLLLLLLFLLVLHIFFLLLPLLLYMLHFHSDFLTLTFLLNGSLLCRYGNEFVKGQSFIFKNSVVVRFGATRVWS